MTILPKILANPARRTPAAGRKLRFDFSGLLENVLTLFQQVLDVPTNLDKKWLATLFGTLLLVLVAVAINLSLSMRASITGRQIQGLEEQITANEQTNADLETKIAQTTSKTNLEERALAAGFEPVTNDQVTYLVVPGYFVETDRSPVKPAEPIVKNTLPEKYTETLLTWLVNNLESASTPLAH